MIVVPLGIEAGNYNLEAGVLYDLAHNEVRKPAQASANNRKPLISKGFLIFGKGAGKSNKSKTLLIV